jgi:hypothetical protein
MGLTIGRTDDEQLRINVAAIKAKIMAGIVSKEQVLFRIQKEIIVAGNLKTSRANKDRRIDYLQQEYAAVEKEVHNA